MSTRTNVMQPAIDAGPLRPASLLRPNVLRGIALMCVAIGLFSCLDITAKYLINTVGLPTAQVVWVRFLGQFGATILAFGLFAIPRLLISARPKQQILRSLFLVSSTVLNFLALKSLRLDQAVTVSFLAPLAVALLAGPLLGEWVGWRRLVAIGVGFGGVLVAVRPGVMTFEPAFMFAFGTVVVYACFQLITRYLAAYDPPEVTLFWSMLAGVIVIAPFGVTEWVTPADAHTWLLFACISMFAAVGHGIFILAYRSADAGTLAPFLYVSLVSHVAGGYFVFGQLPDAWTLAGAAIIIASGLYVLWREHVRAREARTTDSPGKRGEPV
jgi:drug/metabolite transporter (DMT)-like permease